VDAGWQAAQVTMDLERRNGNETRKGSLPDGGDPQIREVVKAAYGELRQPATPVVSSRAQHERVIEPFVKKATDEMVVSSGKRIREPLAVAFRERAPGRTTNLTEPLLQIQTLAMRKAARIAIKAKGRILFIEVGDVIAVEAKGNYVLLLHTSSSYMLRESISTMEEKLNVHGFVRIHRSVLVNAALVEEIQPWSTGEYVLRVRGGREYTVTRTYKKNLQLLAQLWIGMDGFVDD
jgi:DNA-binding LytR/AlgR family response regulator